MQRDPARLELQICEGELPIRVAKGSEGHLNCVDLVGVDQLGLDRSDWLHKRIGG